MSNTSEFLDFEKVEICKIKCFQNVSIICLVLAKCGNGPDAHPDLDFESGLDLSLDLDLHFDLRVELGQDRREPPSEAAPRPQGGGEGGGRLSICERVFMCVLCAFV